MEPAVERREHRQHQQADVRRRRAPQWSPPLKGGSTHGTRFAARARALAPQWSPPLKGGSTSLGGVRLQRGHAPQWSPPLKGGNTAPGFRGRLSCGKQGPCERSRKVSWLGAILTGVVKVQKPR